jgi:hypothetical protein
MIVTQYDFYGKYCPVFLQKKLDSKRVKALMDIGLSLMRVVYRSPIPVSRKTSIALAGYIAKPICRTIQAHQTSLALHLSITTKSIKPC